MYRDYKDKNVQFFYVYKSVEHPEVNGFISAFNIGERLKHIEIAKERFKSEIPWICDTMDNKIKRAFGNSPNGEYVIDPEGKIVRKRFWSNPKTLRGDLEELVGKSETTTKVEDLPARFTPEPSKIASNVLPKLDLPANLEAMTVIPGKSEDPYFAKLRVEVPRSMLQTKMGQIHFAVYLDPIYQVHWNNRAGKVKIEYKSDETLILAKDVLISPDVKEDADIDARHFLVRGVANVSNAPPTPLEVKVTYTVCDNAENFCKEITQDYKVVFEPNRNLGTRPGIFLNGMFADIRKMDKNGDGNLTPDELPENKVSLYIGHMDYNGNDIIEKDELEQFLKMFNNGRGVDPYNDGAKPEEESPEVDEAQESKAEHKHDSKNESEEEHDEGSKKEK